MARPYYRREEPGPVVGALRFVVAIRTSSRLFRRTPQLFKNYSNHSEGENQVKLKLITALAAGLLSAAPAFSLTLDFQDVGAYNFIQEYYNGGTNDAGAYGPNYGISFGLDVLGMTNDEFFQYYDNAPNPGAIAAVGADGALNIAAGFTGAVSFSYSAIAATTVTIFSGLNGTGIELATFNLAATNGTCSEELPFCSWDLASLDLAGIGHSIQFGGTAGLAGFDNITVAPIPVPAAGWLMMSALGGLGLARRNKKKA
jgi:hypothetical protein